MPQVRTRLRLCAHGWSAKASRATGSSSMPRETTPGLRPVTPANSCACKPLVAHEFAGVTGRSPGVVSRGIDDDPVARDAFAHQPCAHRRSLVHTCGIDATAHEDEPALSFRIALVGAVEPCRQS